MFTVNFHYILNCWGSVVISPLSLWSNMNTFCFFLISLDKRLNIFIMLPKKPMPDYTDSLNCFLGFYVVNTALIFTISLLLLHFGFVCCFFLSKVLRWVLKLLIWVSPSFLMEAYIPLDYPGVLLFLYPVDFGSLYLHCN